MDYKVMEQANPVRIPVAKDVKTVKVELGWKAAEALLKDRVKDAIQAAATGDAENVYDLDLAAIIEYSGERKADLVFHGKGFSYDKADSVVLGADSRTGMKKGADEHITVTMKKIPAEAEKISFFVNVHEGAGHKKYLAAAEDVFAQIQKDGKTVYTETEAFKTAEAESATCYMFACLIRGEEGWVLESTAAYGVANEAQDVYEAVIGQPFRK